MLEISKKSKSVILFLIIWTFLFTSNKVVCHASGNTASGTLTINCWGDSVTAGISLPDHHKAILGGETYPSILYTMLNAHNVDSLVINSGFAGEPTSSIIARLGGAGLVLGEDITFSSNCSETPIDDVILAVFNDDLKVPASYTYSMAGINPLTINGKKYTAKNIISSDNKRKTYLIKDDKDDTSVIKAGTPVYLPKKQIGDVNIIFAGINDKSISIDEYVDMLKSGVDTVGDRYIIIGPHKRISKREGFVDGSTPELKQENYEKRMKAEFGDHFLDLSTEWYQRALSVSLDNGYFADYPEDKISAVQAKLDKYIIPSDFTRDKRDNDVHLNKEGNTVIAQIVFEKLKSLGYI